MKPLRRFAHFMPPWWQEQLKYAYNAVVPEGYTLSDVGHTYKLHREEKTWTEAKEDCQKEGGDLASVAYQEVNEGLQKMAQIIGRKIVWLGGRQESGVLSWSDNSTWGYTNWAIGEGSSGDDYYVYMYGENGEWYTITSSTINRNAFICQQSSPVLTGKGKLDLIYKKDQLTFRSFHVWYEYKAASQQVLDSWEDKRMTGFKLTWRIEKPTLVTNNNSEVVYRNHDNSLKPSQTWLVKMVQLAKNLRIKENLTEEQIMDKVIQGKMQNIRILGGQGICSNDQIKSEKVDDSFPNLVSLVRIGNLQGPATDKDVMTGFQVYHAIVYCPEMDMKLNRFVDQLLSSERKRTLIQSFSNLFHSGVLKGTTSITFAKAFYMDLAATLNLQYGNILLATSTKSQLRAVIDIDGPFFTNDTDLVKTCIWDSECTGFQEITEDLGKILSSVYQL